MVQGFMTLQIQWVLMISYIWKLVLRSIFKIKIDNASSNIMIEYLKKNKRILLIILVIAFVFRNMPVGVRAGIASMNQLDPHLDEASTTLNASSSQTFRNIILFIL